MFSIHVFLSLSALPCCLHQVAIVLPSSSYRTEYPRQIRHNVASEFIENPVHRLDGAITGTRMLNHSSGLSFLESSFHSPLGTPRASENLHGVADSLLESRFHSQPGIPVASENLHGIAGSPVSHLIQSPYISCPVMSCSRWEPSMCEDAAALARPSSHVPFSTETKTVYVCKHDNCNKKYSRMPDLRRHYRGSHLEDRRFRCGALGCKRAIHGFSRRDKRNEHERKMHIDIGGGILL